MQLSYRNRENSMSVTVFASLHRESPASAVMVEFTTVPVSNLTKETLILCASAPCLDERMVR
jgi:hypothetical protein